MKRFLLFAFFITLLCTVSFADEVEGDDEEVEYPEGYVHIDDVVEGEGVRWEITSRVDPSECTEQATVGDMVTVHYTGSLEDGTVFDSSVEAGKPFQFQLGGGRVIPGWDEGLLGMCVGEQRQLVIQPEKGYQDQEMGPIPPNSVLHFEVELMELKKGASGPPGFKPVGSRALDYVLAMAMLGFTIAGIAYLMLRETKKPKKKGQTPSGLRRQVAKARKAD